MNVAPKLSVPQKDVKSCGLVDWPFSIELYTADFSRGCVGIGSRYGCK